MSLDFDKAIFIDVFDVWFNEILKPSISLSSYTRNEVEYRRRIKNFPFINIKLIDNKPIHIQSYYNNLFKMDVIIKNPLLAVDMPKNRKITESYKFLTKEDINKIIKAAGENIEIFIFVFAIFTGLRQGEILHYLMRILI